MSFLGNALYTLRRIGDHPLMKSRRMEAYTRWLTWQVGSRLSPGPIVVDYVNETRLCVRAGMHGATMNVYVGLDELRSMAFLLHFLRPDELFVDVGANVGAYTILASGAARARSIAFEPAPGPFGDLLLNVRINDLGAVTDCRRVALSNAPGEVLFTSDLDTLNHIVPSPSEETPKVLRVKASTLDRELPKEQPVLIKMDVEGFEHRVLGGGDAVLRKPTLLALIVEINANCQRYGLTEEETYRKILTYGFASVGYDPMERRLTRSSSWEEGRGAEANTLFVRDLSAATERVKSAGQFRTAAYEI